jgi:hypothetical protein
MTERTRADQGSTVGGLHLQLSGLLLLCLVAAIATTGALIVAMVVGLPPAHPPPGPGGMPPPPPSLQPLAVFPVITGFFVLAWLAALVVFCRDQILRRIDLNRPDSTAPWIDEIVADLRSQLAADREHELRLLEQRFAVLTSEYGEERETDGYLRGMRVAAADDPADAKIHSIRRTPPQR